MHAGVCGPGFHACGTASTDFSDSLSPSVPIIHYYDSNSNTHTHTHTHTHTYIYIYMTMNISIQYHILKPTMLIQGQAK